MQDPSWDLLLSFKRRSALENIKSWKLFIWKIVIFLVALKEVGENAFWGLVNELKKIEVDELIV
jgi:hypothetical protein